MKKIKNKKNGWILDLFLLMYYQCVKRVLFLYA